MRRTVLAAAFTTLLIVAAADLPTRQAPPGQVRLTFLIRDEAGRATGARVRITGADGTYFAPLGHLTRPDAGRRNSGDLILGDDETSPPPRVRLRLRRAFDRPAARILPPPRVPRPRVP